MISLQDVRYPFRVDVPLRSALLLQADGTLISPPTPTTLAALASDTMVLECYPGGKYWGLKVLSNSYASVLQALPIIESPNLWSTFQAQITEVYGKPYQLQIVGTALAEIELGRQIAMTLVLPAL